MDTKRHEQCTGLVVDHLLFHTNLQFSSNQTQIYMWPLHLDPSSHPWAANRRIGSLILRTFKDWKEHLT